MKATKWQTVKNKSLERKDDFQGDFFKDFYNSQGDYTDGSPGIITKEESNAGSTGNILYKSPFLQTSI